jgi:DNA-binding SARP family transcriptional activator
VFNLPGSTAQFTDKLAIQSSKRLYICLFGGFRIFQGDKQLSGDQIHLHKARDLLKLLALALNHRLLREQVLEMLWPDHSPEVAAHNLSQTLYILRPIVAELEPSAQILFEEEYIVLRVNGGISTDVEIFEHAARLALNHAGPVNDQTAACCQEAMVVYTGDLLPEDGASDLFYQHRDVLHKIYLDVLLQLADYHLANHEYHSAIDTLQKVIANDPTNEEAHVRLMRSYALNGQRQAALRQYQSLAEALRNDLEVEPSPESQQLREQIASSEQAPKALPIEWSLTPQHNLPVLISSFIGREAEIGEVRQLLKANRLVTLTGSGGIGKTRLALKVAESLVEDFPQGVFWVELAALTNPEQLAKTIIDVFRLPEQDRRGET